MTALHTFPAGTTFVRRHNPYDAVHPVTWSAVTAAQTAAAAGRSVGPASACVREFDELAELLDVLLPPSPVRNGAACTPTSPPPPPMPVQPAASASHGARTNVHFRNAAVVRAVRRDLHFDERSIAAAPEDVLLRYCPYTYHTRPLGALPLQAADFAAPVSERGRPRLLLLVLNLNVALGRMPSQRDTLALAQMVQDATHGCFTVVNVFPCGKGMLASVEATDACGPCVPWTPSAVAWLITATSNRILMDHEGYYAWNGDSCSSGAAAHDEPAITAPLLFHVYRNACQTAIGQQVRHATVTAPRSPLTFAWATNALAESFNRAAIGGGNAAAYRAVHRAAEAACDAAVSAAAGAYGAWKRASSSGALRAPRPSDVCA